LKSLCPSAGFTTSADDILSDKEIDAVVIATPVFTHYEMAKVLNNDKHVLLEKPMVSKQIRQRVN
jgi:predicted dehydrogenase